MSPLITLFRALADATRIRLLVLVREGPLCVEELARALAIRQPKASRHLAYLRRAGLLKRERSGRRIFYAFHAPPDGYSRKMLLELLGHVDSTTSARKDRRRLSAARRSSRA